MSIPYVHLRVHSEFSLADGIVRIKDLVKETLAGGMPAVAVTDLSNLFAMVKFYQAAIAVGIKPIIGADVWIENTANRNKPFRLVLLCQNKTGVRFLNQLLTRAYTDGQHTGKPCISKSWLHGSTDGLIALSGAQEGDLAQAIIQGNSELVSELVRDYQTLFPGRFYIELQRTGQPFQENYNHAALQLAGKIDIPVVATNYVHFLKPSDFDNHEARVCIHEGRTLSDSRRPHQYTRQQYFRSAEEMTALFSDIPEALANTVEIARRCNLELDFGSYHLPDYPLPENMTIDELLRQESLKGMEARFKELGQSHEKIHRDSYIERLNGELEVIINMGFPGYFLIVADFIQWAKHNDVPVGPGRGSGAGSLVAYALGITDLDPIKYELLFERFLNPERVSMPDFDVDFCMEKRDKVIEYVTERYGKDKVSQIITYGTMAAKAVVRDVGRVMDHPYGFVDKLAKLVPFEVGMTLDKALEQEQILKERYDNEEDVRELIDMALALEGLARNAGKHAGGVVISPTPLTDYMPLYCEQGGKQMVSQLDKDDLESIGLVKFDFLGLRNLTIIDKAVKTINRQRGINGETLLNIEHIPIDDEKTYELLKACRTTALFQLESRGMKDLIKRLKPDHFEEIIALVALFRPGPLQSGMVDDFIARKHGRMVKYPHPSLEPILEPTYGVILYQEQVMQIARELSGYSLGKADLLRRAMGKKKPEEMAKQRDGFVSGAEQRGVNPKLASSIFDLIEKFAGYGFNRSHSAAYALIAYQTAWLKAHYPAAFMAAVLSADMDNTDKVVTMIAECRDMGLDVLPPDINNCQYEFVPVDENTILYGLGAIKGLGQAAIESILDVRKVHQHFTDLFHLCNCIDLKKINRRTLESLVRAGALDNLGPHRASLLESLDLAGKVAGQRAKNQESGISDMFAEVQAPEEVHEFVNVPEWSDEDRLTGEKETLGLYLTGHPIDKYADNLRKMTDAVLAELKPGGSGSVTVAGLVMALRTMQTRRGDRMAFVTLDDKTGRIEMAVFSDLFQQHRDLLVKDSLLVIRGQVSVDDYTGGFKMRADEIYDIDQAQSAFARKLVIDVDAERMTNGFIKDLQQILQPVASGNCRVNIRYHNNEAEAVLSFDDNWRVNVTSSVLGHLEQLAGAGHVDVTYQRA